MELSKDLWALEWSQRQGFFHVQPLRGALEKNGRAFARNSAVDYIILYIGTSDECQDEAERLRPVMTARDQAEAERNAEKPWWEGARHG